MPEQTTSSPRGSTAATGQPRPLVLLVPTELNVRSNGHACILTLAQLLVRAEHPVYLLPYKPFTFYRYHFPRLPPAHRRLPFISDLAEVPDATLIVPESAPPKLVKNLRKSCRQLIWWLLAPAGLLTPFYPKFQLGDLIVAFSEFILPNQSDYLFVHPPVSTALERSAIRYLPQKPEPLQIAFYTGKGRLRPLPRDLHKKLLPYQIVLITRSFPATKESLVRLLEKSNGLISCDPLTNLSLEAAILGTPTFLLGNPFAAGCFEKFPANLADYVTDSSQQFSRWLEQTGPVRKLRTRSLYQRSAQAPQLLHDLSHNDHDSIAQSYLATPELLAAIKGYRRSIITSGTIQAIRDGQSVASLFIRIYLLTLKTPYRYHLMACAILIVIDDVGEILYKLGILKFMLFLVVFMHSLLRLSRRIVRKLSARI